jgi:tRNA threonylcarbamoyladenosine biosynthesis protein TsaE
MKEFTYEAHSLASLKPIAGKIIRDAGSNKLIAFYGAMGAGKTTLIQALCHQLGVKTEVTSPTFALVNEYPSTEGPVFHFDFYRINRIEEALDFGIDEYFDSGHRCFMEWPEKIEELLPEPLARLFIREAEGGVREIRLQIPD